MRFVSAASGPKFGFIGFDSSLKLSTQENAVGAKELCRSRWCEHVSRSFFSFADERSYLLEKNPGAKFSSLIDNIPGDPTTTVYTSTGPKRLEEES